MPLDRSDCRPFGLPPTAEDLVMQVSKNPSFVSHSSALSSKEAAPRLGSFKLRQELAALLPNFKRLRRIRKRRRCSLLSSSPSQLYPLLHRAPEFDLGYSETDTSSTSAMDPSKGRLRVTSLRSLACHSQPRRKNLSACSIFPQRGSQS